MARRATSSTKQRNAPAAAQAAPKAPRRSKKVKQHDMPADDMSVPDALFPGGEEPVATAAPSSSTEPAKARRVRKPRSVELAAEPLTTEDDPAEEASAPAMQPEAADENDAPAAPTPESVATADTEAASSAARLDAATGTASFDWPVIEAVAAASGPNQAMAKLLLAARAEGANSRWPF